MEVVLHPPYSDRYIVGRRRDHNFHSQPQTVSVHCYVRQHTYRMYILYTCTYVDSIIPRLPNPFSIGH